MDFASSVPEQGAGLGAHNQRLQQRIDDLVEKTNNSQAQHVVNEREKSEWIRQTFVAEIWPELRGDYTAMVEKLKYLLQSRLTLQGIPFFEVQCRAKAMPSVEQSLERRESELWEQTGHTKRHFEDLKDIFRAMHDLAGLRIVLMDPNDFALGHQFIERTFELEKPPAHFKPDREVGQH